MSSGWIEGEFEGVYSGARRAGGARRAELAQDDDAVRRFDFELESGRLRALASSQAPGEDPDEEVIRQERVHRVLLPPVEGQGAPCETTLFDVHISDWQLKHPAEARGRAYGTIVGTLRARLAPAVPDAAPDAPQPLEVRAAPLPPAPSGERPAARKSRRRTSFDDDDDPDATFSRFLWNVLLVLLALIGAAIAAACGPRTVASWAAPLAAGLLLLRATRGGLLRRGSGWVGAAAIATQLWWLWGALELAWQSGCWPPLQTTQLAGLALPVAVSAAAGARWAAWMTGSLWTLAVCAACASPSGSGCTSAPPSPALARVRATAPANAPRTDADGRWPVMPAPGLQRADARSQSAQRGERDGEARVPVGTPPGVPEQAPTAPAAQGAGRSGTSDASPSAELAIPSDALRVPFPDSTAQPVAPHAGERGPGGASVDGGWVSPDHRRTERELVLISVEQANRRPGLFFESAGARRVYVPTDPVFEDGSSRLRSDAGLVLARVAALLSLPSQPLVALDVHSDSNDAPENQIELSRRRAASIRGWLVDRGHVDPRRFRIHAVGGAHPLVPPDGTYAAQQPNRRIEIRLVPSG